MPSKLLKTVVLIGLILCIGNYLSAEEKKRYSVIYPAFLNSTTGMQRFLLDIHKTNSDDVRNIFAKYDIDIGEVK